MNASSKRSPLIFPPKSSTEISSLLAMVNSYGATTAAAYAAAAQLWGYVQLPSNALAMAMTAMAAMNIGAGRWDRVAQIARRGCALSFVIAVGVSYAPLHDEALRTAEEIGEVEIAEAGGTTKQLSSAAKPIREAAEKGKVGRKRRAVRC